MISLLSRLSRNSVFVIILHALTFNIAMAQTVTVKLWGTGGYAIPRKDETDPFARANRAVIEAFEHQHPDIRLEVVSGLEIQGPAAESGLLMAMAGGNAPDVIYVNFRKLDNYVRQGILYPMDEFIAGDPAIMNRVHAQIRDVVTIDGKVYAYPYSQVVQALYYRKDYFREAGLDPEKPPTTWDEFYHCAKAITNPETGRWGFLFESNPQGTSWYWVNFLWQAGGEPVRQLQNGRWEASFNSAEGISALMFYRKLVTDVYVLPNGKLQRGVATRVPKLFRDYVEKGKVGMWFAYQTDVIANRAAANLSASIIGIAPLPQGPTGIRANEINAYMFGISALQNDPKVRNAAWQFIKFMGSEEADAIRTKAYVDSGIGGNISPELLIKFGYGDLVTAQGRKWAESLKQLFETGKPEPHGKNCELIYTEMDAPLVEIGIYPTQDPQELLNRAAKRINSKMLGYVPPEVMANRRRLALGIVTGGGMIVGVVTLWSLWGALKHARSKRGARNRRPIGLRKPNNHFAAWVFMAPAVLSIALWAYFPLVRGLVMAFQDYKIIQPARFVGLDNFIEASASDTFWIGIAHSFEYVGLTLGIGFALPIILALLLSEIPFGKLFFRAVYYLPAITSGLVILFLWKIFYSPSNTGLMNQILAHASTSINSIFGWVGIHSGLPTEYHINWLGDPSWAMLAVVLPAVWAAAGPGSIIYLAALKTISDDIYEAADLDGASVWMKIRVITLPSLKPLIIINLVGAFIGSFKAMENIFVMTGGGPLNRTHTIGLEIWYNAFMYLKFGYATAAAWMMGTMLICFTLYQLRILKTLRFTAGG